MSEISGRGYARGGILYATPRSRWGRLRNRLRRLAGLDERDEIVGYLRRWPDGVDFGADTVRIIILPDGLFVVDE
jgi:hypothetical protein